MKTIYRVLMLGLFTVALTAVTATSLFAQDAACADIEAKQAVYKKFTDNYASKDIPKMQIAIDAGNEYIEKYGNCPEDKEIVTYLNKSIPAIKAVIEAQKVKGVNEARNALFTRFDTALKAKNTADIYSIGKEVLAKEPDFVDVMIVLATAGYDQSAAKPPVDTYNNEAVNYARSSIQKIESGTKSTTGAYGVGTYSYKYGEFDTPEKAKSNALGWMNYIVGYIDFYRLGKKKEGLEYLYKASTANSATKSIPSLYQTIGSYYRDEVIRLGKEIVDKIEIAGKETDETKAIFALEKGYADRAIDAYARAYKVADPKNKAYKDEIYDTIKEIYKLRFEGKGEGVDAYMATLTSQPMPDPTTEVKPVVEEGATTATTSGTTTPMTTPAGMTKPATKPATTTTKPPTTDNKKPPATPMSSTDKNSTTKVTVTKTSETAKTKPPVKKPAPKK